MASSAENSHLPLADHHSEGPRKRRKHSHTTINNSTSLPLLPYLAASRVPAALVDLESLQNLRDGEVPDFFWHNDSWATLTENMNAGERSTADVIGRSLRERWTSDDRSSDSRDFEVDAIHFTVVVMEEQGVVVVNADAAHLRATPSPAVLGAVSRPTDDYISAIATTEMGRLIASFPWETTLLGPIDKWSQALKTTVAAMLASPIRICIFWTKEHVICYNDAYIASIQTKHPSILGQRFQDAWPEIWDSIEDMLMKAWQGESIFHDNSPLFLDRQGDGLLEETYHSYNFIGVRDERGAIVGISNSSIETTNEVIAERRMATVRNLVSSTSGERTVAGFCEQALQCLGLNPYDLPFAQLYTCQVVEINPLDKKGRRAGESDSQRVVVDLQCRGTVGIPEDHPATRSSHRIHLSPTPSYPSASLRLSSPALPVSTSKLSASSWPFAEACETRKAVLVADIEALTEAFNPTEWGDRARQAVVIPIFTEGPSLAPQAVVVFGLNPRGLYTDLYRSFTEIVARHLSIGLLAVTNAEEDARRAKELVALDEAKSRFWGNASHELRTPLTLILGPLQDVMSRKEKLPFDARNKLELVARNGERLLTMVNKLLDFSALEGSRQRQVFQPVKLARFTRELSTLFRDAIERQGIRFNVSCEDDDPHWAPPYLSNDLYQHVFSNLVGNALKYTASGSITVELTASVNELTLFVKDTGAGIPEHDLGLIFDRFHRVESSSGSASGSGIGLALTLEVVKSLGAQLNVTSELGKGSTFSVEFRRGYAHLPSNQVSHQEADFGELSSSSHKLTEAEIKDANGYRTAVDARVSTPSLDGGDSGSFFSFDAPDPLNVAGATVLLVDDSPDLRSYIGGLLRKHYTVIEAEDGQTALELALQNPPSLVVTDVMMPRMSGEDLFVALRGHASTVNIPVIFLSAQAGVEARALALECGVDDYLVKPFQSRELLARVKIHLQLAKMRAELEEKVATRTAELEANRRHLELFIDVAMHEVRNPLSGALQNATVLGQSIRRNLGRLQDLKDKKLDLDHFVQELSVELSQDLVSVDDILLCTTHQSRIANDILNVSKLHMGLLSVVGVPFDFVSKMQSTYRLFVSECRENDIDFNFEVHQSIHDLDASWVIADPDRLAQVAINFITNGLKFTARTGTLTMTLSASHTPSPLTDGALRFGETEADESATPVAPVWITATVSDSGKGLSTEELKKLFTRFGQANPNVDQYGGSGLGLYISKKLIELHHGFIEVESTIGMGSIFSFCIPVERAAPLMFSRSPSPLASLTAPPLPESSGTRAVSILVVEDNVINQRILKRQLVARKFEVTVANNGQEALDLLREGNFIETSPVSKFDIVLMDILMPVMDGLTAVKELRAWETTHSPESHYNVIAVTGNARQGQVEEYLSNGFDDIAIKPYKFDKLLEQIAARVRK